MPRQNMVGLTVKLPPEFTRTRAPNPLPLLVLFVPGLCNLYELYFAMFNIAQWANY